MSDTMRTQPASPPTQASEEQAVSCLVVLECPDADLVGTRVSLEHGHLVIGRSEEARSHLAAGGLWVADQKISFIHVVLRQVEGSLIVSDVGSTNGSHLGGKNIGEQGRGEACWGVGESLRVGATLLKGLEEGGAEARSYQAMQEKSLRDALTGAHNRAHFDLVLARDVESAVRNNRPLCLCLLDIDHFKRVNDTFGHDAGDQVLQEVVRRVGERVRASDLFARTGGEEFALLLQDADLERGAAIAEELRQRVANGAFPTSDGEVPVTVSIGVAQLDKDETGRSLMKRADQNLYRAKAKGRDRVCS